MSKRLVHTPEGVRDIYGLEYARKAIIENRMQEVFASYGYKNIQTPTFEFFDVFSKEIGTKPSNELYKFFDKEGNTLVLRPDFTPSMARCAAKYFMDETIPVRFSYVGNTFCNTSDLQGKFKEMTQTGVELIGDGSVEADAEMITLAMEALKKAGLKEFQISIGEIEFFKGLCEEAGLEKETELEVREQISNKNYFGVEEILTNHQIKPETIKVFLQVIESSGSIESLKDAEALVTNEKSKNALKRLYALYELLQVAGAEKYCSFDLGMVSKYHYYTGIIFRAYTYGVGDAILAGGRYDALLSYFGKNAPAVGFMIVVDDLMVALQSQHLLPKTEEEHIMLLFEEKGYADAFAKASKMRAEGKNVAMQLIDATKSKEDYIAFANLNFTDSIIFPNGEIVTVS